MGRTILCRFTNEVLVRPMRSMHCGTPKSAKLNGYLRPRTLLIQSPFISSFLKRVPNPRTPTESPLKTDVFVRELIQWGRGGTGQEIWALKKNGRFPDAFLAASIIVSRSDKLKFKLCRELQFIARRDNNT